MSEPGWDRFTFYKLMDSVVESPKDKDGHEQDFFDGIDTSLPALATGSGAKRKGSLAAAGIGGNQVKDRSSSSRG